MDWTSEWDHCSPRYESENRVGVYSEKCQMQLSSVLALYSGAINHLFVISIHSIILMNALNRNMISLPKFHSFIVFQRSPAGQADTGDGVASM